MTAALAPRKSCFLPCNANLHTSSALLKHGLPPPAFFEWSSFPAHRLVVITHVIVKLRCKKETAENWQQSTKLEKTARIRVLVFLFFHFPSAVVRSSKIEVFGMATVGRGYNELERRRVIKTLLDAGVESTRELSERSGLCKAPNETKKRLKWESGKRQQLKPVLSWQHVQAHLTSNARATQNFFKVGEVASTGGFVAAPIWPHGALRRSFWWSLINDVSDSISLSQAVCVYSIV